MEIIMGRHCHCYYCKVDWLHPPRVSMRVSAFTGLIEIKFIAKKIKKEQEEKIEALSMWNAMISLLAFLVNCMWKYIFKIINLYNIWNSNILFLWF